MQVFRDYRLIECETTMRRLAPIAIREVAVFDTEEVVPVVHAHWVEDDDGVHCSKCKKDAPLEVFTYSFHPTTDLWEGDVKFNKSEFCQHCGAKMDEEVE